MDRGIAREFKSIESIVHDSIEKSKFTLTKGVKNREVPATQATSRDIASIKKFFTSELKDGDAFHNWMGNISFKPEKIFYPESLQDLKDCVNTARKNGKKIRCAAQGHTWSSLSVTSDYLVIVNKLDKVEVEKRNDGYVVHVEAGAQISKIDSTLEHYNPSLTLPSMTLIDTIRIGGIVAPGCHGAEINLRTIVDQVIGLQIVTGDGELREFSDEKNREEMEAARVSLGLLGIIYRVTLRAEPMYNLRMIDTYPLKSTFTSAVLKDLIKDSDALEIFYWPFNSQSKDTEKLWVKRWKRSTDAVNLDDFQQVLRRISQSVSTEIGNNFYQQIIENPEKTPIITNLASKLRFIEHNDVWEAPYAIHYQAGIDNIPVEDLEFAIKVDKNFDNIVTEINHVIDKIYEYAGRNQYPINIAFEMRILKSSRATLANSYDEDPEAYYFYPEVLSIKDTPYYRDFSTELAQRWMEKYNATPHWAKHWEYVPNIHQHIHNKLGDRIKKFEAIRVKYDPTNIFFDNESLKRVFYETT